LPPEQFIPAPGQGALGIQTREDDGELCKLVANLDETNARITAQTERRILAGLHGGCSIPLGVYSHISNNTIHIHAILSNLTATQCIEKTVSCPIEKAIETADLVTRHILDEGGREILEELRLEKKD